MRDESNESLKAFLETEDGKKVLSFFHGVEDIEEGTSLMDEFIKSFISKDFEDDRAICGIIDEYYDDIKSGALSFDLIIDKISNLSYSNTIDKYNIIYKMILLISGANSLGLLNNTDRVKYIKILKDMDKSSPEEYKPNSSSEEYLNDSDLRKRIKYTRNPMQKKKYHQMLSGYKYTGAPGHSPTKKKYRKKK